MDFKEDCFITESDDNLSEMAFMSSCSSSQEGNQKKAQAQVDQLFREIRTNLWSCDVILCFFIAALQSYRAIRCLRPFPSMYINEDGKNFNALRATCDSIPSLESVLNEPKKCPKSVFTVLAWLFLEKGKPGLKRININSVPFPSKFTKMFIPHYVFEVCYQEKLEGVWQKRKHGRETIFAYHGSAIDNFYSILKVGLQQHFSFEKEVLFGNGIYLSDDIALSAHYSPFGRTWENSILGSKHSVIALCEIINDVDKVKCKDAKNKNRSVNKDSISGEIPEKYFVVTDTDMLRVKYLLVYRKTSKGFLSSFVQNNSFLFMLSMYLFAIFLIAVYSNSYCVKLLKRLQWFNYK